MHSPVRSRVVFLVLAVAVVFLGIEAIEAVIATQALPAPLHFAALHTVGVVVFGALSIIAVIAAVVLEPRWLVLLIAAVIAAAAVALLFV